METKTIMMLTGWPRKDEKEKTEVQCVIALASARENEELPVEQRGKIYLSATKIKTILEKPGEPFCLRKTPELVAQYNDEKEILTVGGKTEAGEMLPPLIFSIPKGVLYAITWLMAETDRNQIEINGRPVHGKEAKKETGPATLAEYGSMFGALLGGTK